MRLGDMLLRANVVTELQLNAALAEQQHWGGKLGQILVRMGALTEDLFVLALCRQLNLPRADLDAVQGVPELLKRRLDQAMCERCRILPLAYVAERRVVQLAMSDPLDIIVADDVARLLGMRIEPSVAGDTALATAIRRLYSATSSESFAQQSSEPMSLIDNFGNTRGPIAQGSAVRSPPASAQPDAGPASPAAPIAQRIDEQVRAVRAVAELLLERGVIGHDDLKC